MSSSDKSPSGFSAPELNRDGSFSRQPYAFHPLEDNSWEVSRNKKSHLSLGPGYQVYKTIACGVCSTDLAKPCLPYPLPQIIGHEVVVNDGDNRFCVEINASHLARSFDIETCPFCSQQLSTHCPERLTLGIDRLPGGFSPFLLAPQNSLHKCPASIPTSVATLVEPLAAAIQALKASRPQSGDHVAVLGPRRLGSLILMALADFRKTQQLDFKISALIRHENLQNLCLASGADDIVMTHTLDSKSPGYDIVYDTTGKPEGFDLALQLTRRELHLKSTHGQPVDGATHWADFVVDELALSSDHSVIRDFSWTTDHHTKGNPTVFCSNLFNSDQLEAFKIQFPNFNFFQAPIQEGFIHQFDQDFQSACRLPRFDGAFMASMTEFDELVRPKQNIDHGIVRPRGWIYCPDLQTTTNLSQNLKRGIKIQSSRCGPFDEAIQLLERNPEFVSLVKSKFITHHFKLSEIDKAMKVASDSRQSLKVIVDTQS